MKVLITMGPTQEPIDDFRFITNASSGKMGAALAIEALARGHDVTLIHGPVALGLPDCKKLPVRTAGEMLAQVLSELKEDYDIFISVAAVSDYAPKKTCGKIKSGECIKLELNPTPKIIDEARKAFPRIFIVGFKAEYGLGRDELKAKARNFLHEKGIDLLVANDVEKSAMGDEEIDVIVVGKEILKEFGRRGKREIADYIWNEIELHKTDSCQSS